METQRGVRERAWRYRVERERVCVREGKERESEKERMKRQSGRVETQRGLRERAWRKRWE